MPHNTLVRRVLLVVVVLCLGAVSALLQGSRPPLTPRSAPLAQIPGPRPSPAPPAAATPTVDPLVATADRQRLDGAYEEAAASYRQALQRNPSSGQLAMLAAEASLAAGDAQGALDMARQALQRRPDLTDAHMIEAEALVALGRSA